MVLPQFYNLFQSIDERRKLYETDLSFENRENVISKRANLEEALSRMKGVNLPKNSTSSSNTSECISRRTKRKRDIYYVRYTQEESDQIVPGIKTYNPKFSNELQALDKHIQYIRIKNNIPELMDDSPSASGSIEENGNAENNSEIESEVIQTEPLDLTIKKRTSADAIEYSPVKIFLTSIKTSNNPIISNELQALDKHSHNIRIKDNIPELIDDRTGTSGRIKENRNPERNSEIESEVIIKKEQLDLTVKKRKSTDTIENSHTKKIKLKKEKFYDTSGTNEANNDEGYFSTSPENSSKEKSPVHSTKRIILEKWLYEHRYHPYPTQEEKVRLLHETGLNLNQIKDWFANARRRKLRRILAYEADKENKSPVSVYQDV